MVAKKFGVMPLVRGAGDRVVHHVEPAPRVLFSERLELVELRAHFLPGKVQGLRNHRFRIDENLVRHQHSAVGADADHPVGTLAARIADRVFSSISSTGCSSAAGSSSGR